ncbi:MAG: diaminopimelate decarboxylase [Oscillospiraceae bacterium]|nr:diaminopimelate decarboxylase [Oscillospiraceae bacterium]
MIYKNLSINDAGHLVFAGHDTASLAAAYGTPLLVMDEELIRSRCRAYKAAMEQYLPAGSHPLYASKALSMKRIYEIMREEGMGVDVVSVGELYTAAKAGFPMENAYFHGNSKTDRDIALAMDHGIGYFVCDNADELDAINAEAGRRGIRQKLLLRLTPGIDPHTHEKINTGRIDSKFGAAIETGQAEELILRALGKENVELCGYHCHIGSQIFDPTPFCDAAVLMLKFVAEIKEKHGFCAPVVNLGGGMGVPYVAGDSAIDYAANIKAIGELIAGICKDFGLEAPAILMEPGRSIVADAGMTLYTAASIKKIPGFKNYVAIDGGMTDNPRYTLYQSSYTILPASRMNDYGEQLWTVAGCCCESGDLIQEDVCLPEMRRGDLLAVLTTGAYNYSMASNYNRVSRPPIVMLGENGPYIAVRRETLDDLLSCDL